MPTRTSGVLLGSLLLLGANGLAPNLAWGQAATADAQATLDAKPIGKIVSATGSFHVEHASAIVVQANLSPNTETKVGDAVYRGDLIQTGPNGTLGVVFADGTSFNASPNAKVTLTEFIYDPDGGKSNSALLSLTQGTFTFIAGKIAKTGDMKIDTPVATMGIRGTAPRVEISPNGTVKFSTLIEQK
jgi:hypothetical protein